MATLTAAKQWSANTAKTRLKQVSRERPLHLAAKPELAPIESLQALPNPTSARPSFTEKKSTFERTLLTEMEQRQLLLQTVAVYKGWHLVSVQHRPENDALVAHLVYNDDSDDPTQAIRNGHALQIIMDGVGDLKVQHPRHRKGNSLTRLFRQLARILGILRDKDIFSPYIML